MRYTFRGFGRRAALAACVAVAISACGDDDTTTGPLPPPSPEYPLIGVIWTYEAPSLVGQVGGVATTCRAFNAVMTISQSGRSFDGTINNLLLNCDQGGGIVQFGPLDSDLLNGMIETNGQVVFEFGVVGWFNVGAVGGSQMSGTATLGLEFDGTTASFNGAFGAKKQS